MLGPKYLRVLTPQTVDGINLKYDDSSQVVYKETHLPLSARKYLDQENADRPKQLLHIITVVDETQGPTIPPDKLVQNTDDGFQQIGGNGSQNNGPDPAGVQGNSPSSVGEDPNKDKNVKKKSSWFTVAAVVGPNRQNPGVVE